MRKDQEAAERENNKAASAAEEERLRVEILTLLTENVVKYSNRPNKIQHDNLVKDITGECNVMFLKEIFVCYYNLKKGGFNGNKKSDLVALMVAKITAANNNTHE